MAFKNISNLLLALFVLVLGIAEILAAVGQNLTQYTGWVVGVLGILAGLTLFLNFTPKKSKK